MADTGNGNPAAAKINEDLLADKNDSSFRLR